MPDSQRPREFNPAVHRNNPVAHQTQRNISERRSSHAGPNSSHAASTNHLQSNSPVGSIQYHNAQLTQQITQSVISSFQPSIQALYENQKIISQTIHAVRNEGRQQTKEIMGVVEASHLMTSKALKRVFERVDNVGAGVSTGKQQGKTVVERLDGIECAILELAERVYDTEAPLPEITRHEIAISTDPLRTPIRHNRAEHADACIGRTPSYHLQGDEQRLQSRLRVSADALVVAMGPDVFDSTPSGSGLRSQATSPNPSGSTLSRSVSGSAAGSGSGNSVIRIPGGRSAPSSAQESRNRSGSSVSAPEQVADEDPESQKEHETERPQVPSYPKSYNNFWMALNTFKSRIRSASDSTSASGSITMASGKRKRVETDDDDDDDDDEEEEAEEVEAERRVAIPPTSSDDLALAQPADFQSKGIHPSSLASSSPVHALVANPNPTPVFTPSKRTKTPAREIEDGSVASLRKEVLGDHLFVRPLEDFGLESLKEDEGVDENEEQTEEGVQPQMNNLPVHEESGVDLEEDEQAEVEELTGDQPAEISKAGEGDGVQDVQAQMAEPPIDGGGVINWGDQEPTVSGEVGDDNTQGKSAEESSSLPHLPNLSPISQLTELDAEDDAETEGPQSNANSGSGSANTTLSTDLDPDLDMDLYNECLGGEIDTPRTTPGPVDNPELAMKEELGFDSISFERESLSPLTSLSGDESEEENAYLNAKGKKRKLSGGAEERKVSKKVKAHRGDANRQRRSTKSPGILLQGEERCSNCRTRDRPCSARPGRHCKYCRKQKLQCSLASSRTASSSVPPGPTASTSTSWCEWPAKSDGDINFLVQFIGCDICHSWYHYGCVGIVPGDLRCEDGEEFTCPLCSESPRPLQDENPNCARPDCTFPKEDAGYFVVDRIVGRKPIIADDTFANADFLWLVTWQGYPISMAEWVPEENMGDSARLVSKFNEDAAQEGFALDTEDRIFLNEAYEGGWRE